VRGNSHAKKAHYASYQIAVWIAPDAKGRNIHFVVLPSG
jgi:hypothetical protein